MACLQIHGYQKKVLVDAGWGDPPHCTTLAEEFLIEKFQGRVISQGSPITWSAHSPDLNPLRRFATERNGAFQPDDRLF